MSAKRFILLALVIFLVIASAWNLGPAFTALVAFGNWRPLLIWTLILFLPLLVTVFFLRSGGGGDNG